MPYAADERADPQLLLDALANAIDDDDYDEDDDGYPSLYVGPALRTLRQRAGMRQSEIARHLGIDSSIPSRWEGYDSTHAGQTTRYKPVPGKYFLALTTLLGCTIGELAPELAPPVVVDWTSSATTYQVTLPASAYGSATMSYTGAGTISGYTLGGGITTYVPPPVPGLPPETLRERGEWRRHCPNPHCHKAFIENAVRRAPLVCDACATPVRAQTAVTVTSTS